MLGTGLRKRKRFNAHDKLKMKQGIEAKSGLHLLRVIFLDDLKCDKCIYVSWNGLYSNDNGENIVLDRSFASKFLIAEGESVIVQTVRSDSYKCDPCLECHIRPLNDQDYEILTANAEEVEEGLLNQLRVITTTCMDESPPLFTVYPIWLKSSPSRPLFVQFCHIEPKNEHCVVLVQSTKLIILAPSENIVADVQQPPKQLNDLSMIRSTFATIFKTILPRAAASVNSSALASPVSNKVESKSLPVYDGKAVALRVLPYKYDSSELQARHHTALISSVHFRHTHEKRFLVKLRKLMSACRLRKLKKSQAEAKDYTLDVSNLPTDVAFHTKLVDKCLKNYETQNELIVLVFADDKCPPDSIVLDATFRSNHSLVGADYVHLSAIVDDAKFIANKFTRFEHTLLAVVPVVASVTLFPLSVDPQLAAHVDVHKLKSTINETLSVGNGEQSILNNNLLVSNGFILKLGQINFIVYYNHVEIFDLDACDLQKLFNLTFVIDCNTELVVKSVTIKHDLTKLLARNVQQLDDERFALMNDDAILNRPFGGFTQMFNKLLDSIGASNCKTLLNILVCGPKGSGKSTLVQRVMHYLVRNEYVYTQVTPCTHLKGKRLESLKKLWTQLAQEAIQHAPSLLVFEDLDQLVPFVESSGVAEKWSEDEILESVYSQRVAHVFHNVCDTLRLSASRVIVLATSKSLHSLHHLLHTNVFAHVTEIALPSARQRAAIVQDVVKKKRFTLSHESIGVNIQFDMHKLCRDTRNYGAHDLSLLLDMAVHNALVQALQLADNVTEKIDIAPADVAHALQAYAPPHLTSLKPQIHSSITLADVGALDRVKHILLDTILLSVRHPRLFALLPLRAQNSILLYGMPGVGKTILVQALAHESGLSFIGVKGPELLSKYIGASEQSVRDLFARAQAAAPCLLFFDEFDSLAPRRGHDSTGVTDRIVNQMLTLLDGLEEMRRDVYILAATSRPDLIDLALLRPGRFDRCLLCDMPNQADRVKILTVLTRKVSIDPEVKLEELARSTSNFTGADLQALLYNAYLAALNRINNENIETAIIAPSDIELALASTKPSLSEAEQTRFRIIYDRFNSELSGGIVSQQDRSSVVTLA